MSFLSQINEVKAVLSETRESFAQSVEAALSYLIAVLHRHGTIYVAGNGGSASQAAHFAAELVGIGLRCVNLAADSAILTALANDHGYESVFDKQVDVLGTPRDLYLGITTSGRSANILRPMEVAQRIGMKRIILTGKGASIDGEALHVIIPSTNAQRIQELHLMVLHYWYAKIKEVLC